MIFASDLDQTLMFSSRHFLETDNNKKRLVETLDGEKISYMTEEAIKKLKKIASQVMFVPVTTRTIMQYSRITIFHEEIVPKYVVTSNGGNILIDGKIDEYWSKYIKRKIEDTSIEVDLILARFDEIKSEAWFKNGRMADDLFYYCIVEREQLPLNEIRSFGDWCNDNGWNLSVQGRKVYLVPNAVNKADAVLHIKEKENKTYLCSSGDSLLDAPLLFKSDFAIAPSQGELYDNKDSYSVTFTNEAGPQASEEILDRILERITSNEVLFS
ncbi:HAD family hydrolase [Brevibacillus sp. SYSU BS000544]|uniref:HAD family hydrolase n=1 Tax=Brevibacillus sp. SYSU BS000544 TaxID=3416443 RepID=UPI003CE4D7D7